MSREEQGLAPADAGPPIEIALAPPDDARAGLTGSSAVAARPWFAPSIGVIALAVGWIGAGLWRPPAEPPAALPITAVVLQARADAVSRPSPVRGAIRLRLSNPGDQDAVVVGYEPPNDIGFIAGLEPRRLRLPAGGTAELRLQFGVRCQAAVPFELPALRVRVAEGGARQVPLGSAAAALAGVCTGWPGQEPLEVTGVQRDDDGLAVGLRSPVGRSTLIESVEAGGVPLPMSPLAVTVDGDDTTLRLGSLNRCPVRWRQLGIPQRLDVVTDLGGSVVITLVVGPALSDWLLDTACRTVTP